MRTPMSARVAPMEQAPAPAMLVPLDAPGDQRLALGLDLRADEVRCVALRQDGSIVAPAVTHRLENVALLGAVAALANAARAYVADVGRAWADVACVGVAPPGEVDVCDVRSRGVRQRRDGAEQCHVLQAVRDRRRYDRPVLPERDAAHLVGSQVQPQRQTLVAVQRDQHRGCRRLLLHGRDACTHF